MAEIQKIQTPQGDLKYCFVTGQGRLKPRSKDQYSYSAAVVLDKKQGKKLYAEICDYFNENKPSKCTLDEPENKIYTKLDDGRMMFQFRTNTEFDGKPNKVKIFNSKNEERVLPEGIGIGDGSTGSIKGALLVYEGETPKTAGCSMFLHAIRIAKFVKYEGSDGFDDDGAEDGDFEDFEDADFPEETKKSKPKKSRDEDDEDEDEEVVKPKKDKKKKKKKKSSEDDE